MAYHLILVAFPSAESASCAIDILHERLGKFLRGHVQWESGHGDCAVAEAFDAACLGDIRAVPSLLTRRPSGSGRDGWKP